MEMIARGRAYASASLMLVLAWVPLGAQSQDDRAFARDLIAKKSSAFITVLATGKMHMTMNGKEATNDLPVNIGATVLTPQGLAVTSLSAIQPENFLNARARAQGGAAAQMQVTSEITDIRMRLPDGREVPAQVVLRDADLDLAFLRPTDAPAQPMAVVTEASGKPAVMDLVITLSRTDENLGYRAIGSFGTVEIVIDRPRTYYLLNDGRTVGSPVFDMQGRLVGITVTRATGGRGGPSIGVLPADDIREVAKQVKP